MDSPRRPSVLLPPSGRSVGTAAVSLFMWCVRPKGQSFVFWYYPGPLNTLHMRRTVRDLRADWALVFSGGAPRTSRAGIIGARTNGPETFCVWVDDPQTLHDLENPGHGGHEKPPHPYHPSARSRDIGIAIWNLGYYKVFTKSKQNGEPPLWLRGHTFTAYLRPEGRSGVMRHGPFAHAYVALVCVHPASSAGLWGSCGNKARRWVMEQGEEVCAGL